MPGNISITRVQFKHFKAFENYSISLQDINILTGPNNSGKSTILNAFRVLAAGVRRANARNAEVVVGPSGPTWGHVVSTEDIPMSFENVHTNYDKTQHSTVVFTLTNGKSLTLYFSADGQCILIPDNARSVRSPSTFKKEFPILVDFVPVLGPLEHDEPRVELSTVQRNLATHRASRNFRNYWRFFPDDFQRFAELLRSTWSGMDIQPPETISFNQIAMFCIENGNHRELYWAGFGFQIWCQLLTHIVRTKTANLLVVDEPEIYLHPDLQRQLLSILRETGPDILLATHSTEIITEADPDEILLIDKSRKSATRLKNIDQVQDAIELLGSIQNITLTQLSRTKRVLSVEGTDFKILSRFARVLNLTRIANQSDFAVVATEGYSQWSKLKAFKWGFEKLIGQVLVLGAVFDRDYRCDEQIQAETEELMQNLNLVHFHKRKELENYLLVPHVLDRAIRKKMLEAARRNETDISETPPSEQILDEITSDMRTIIQAKYIAERTSFLSRSSIHASTITQETIEIFDRKWADINSRMEIVPGKEVFSMLNRFLQENYKINLTPISVIAEFQRYNVPTDLANFLRRLDEVFRIAQPH
jgi:energy-coupling factor transporter ATP-binding protein EcfA2